MGLSNNQSKDKNRSPNDLILTKEAHFQSQLASISLPPIRSILPPISDYSQRPNNVVNNSLSYEAGKYLFQGQNNYQYYPKELPSSQGVPPLDEANRNDLSNHLPNLSQEFIPKPRKKYNINNNQDLSPDSIEKRRKNAEASSKSRIRRRIREKELYDRNRELEILKSTLKVENDNLNKRLITLEDENYQLRLEINNMKVGNQHNIFYSNPSILDSKKSTLKVTDTLGNTNEVDNSQDLMAQISELKTRCLMLENELIKANKGNKSSVQHYENCKEREDNNLNAE